MSKRDFGTTKCLLHFDFPYFNEPNDGLDDDVGIETWSEENTNVKLYGSQIPIAGTRAPKFGYRCLSPYTGGAVGTNTSGIWNMNSSGNYEIECFVFGTSTGTRHLLRLYNSENTEVLTVSITTDRQITVLCSDWGIDSEVTSTTAFTASAWQHVLLRVSNNTLKVFIEGTECISEALTPDVALSVNSVKLGYTSTQGALFIDEFVFRHKAGSDTPTVSTHPYSGQLILDTVGGYKGVGSLSDGTVDSASGTLNSYGLISAITDAKTFTVSSWSSSGATAEAGREVMIHITAPRSTASAAYPLVGLYAFAKIESVDETSVVLSKDITTANGYDFTLDSSLLSTYYVQAITVPRYDSLTVSGSVTPTTWSTTTGGGIVALRTTGDCTVNGSILTHGTGAVRYDLHQMTNSKLIDRFLCSQGGGVFISCGGTLTIGSSARLGASWSGAGDGSNGAAGYGGNGGGSTKASGGAGGVGGGGGGATQNSSSKVEGGACGSKGGAGYNGSGGGGCGGAGGKSSNSSIGVSGSGGGGQAGSGGSGGTGGVVKGNAGTINGGDCMDYWDDANQGGAGGGGAGGNGGKGGQYTGGSGSDSYASLASGVAGASIILIAKMLNTNAVAISTGGSVGTSYTSSSSSCRIGAAGGGGTGFCYIACEKQVSA